MTTECSLELFALYIFWSRGRYNIVTRLRLKKVGGNLPDWLMRREKPPIASSLGRCGARYTSSIICASPSVVPSTARLLTTRMSN
jgi:hypothetical protein